jgi:hypothetical protein
LLLKDGDNEWQHTDRFDLTDIETNTFIQSKSRRRTIVYGGYKTAADGTKKVFSEKKIHNIRFRASLNDEDQQLIISAMNKAIASSHKAIALDMFVYLMGNGDIQGGGSTVTDTSNTPRWPEVEFLQPLDGIGPGVAPEDGDDCGYFGSCSEGSGFGGGISIFGMGGMGGF